MTRPTPPPGWHSDPSSSDQLRWWDGQRWTDQYQDRVPLRSSTSAARKVPMSRGKGIAVGIGVTFLVLFVISLIGKAMSPNANNDHGDAALSSSSKMSVATTPSVVAAPSSPLETTTASSSAQQSARPTAPKPSGCKAVPDQYLMMINEAFKSGYSLINTSAYQVGSTLYIAGEIADSRGGIRSRDDVFAVKGDVVTPVTITARNESTLPDLRRLLDVSVLDEGAQTAMDCARTY